MIQFNYPSNGIGKKERKRYVFSDFRGVDASVVGINVDPSHAVESMNFVDRNGVLHKRYGWEQIYQFDAEINGFWDINIQGVSYKICYAGNKFYRLLADGWEMAYSDENRLVSRRTACYLQNNKAYFVGCGDYIVFKRSDEGGYTFSRVIDDAETFVPITTARILPDHLVEKGLKGRYVRDSVNRLTGWRKNTLVGTAVENGEITYRLDSAPELRNGLKAYISFPGGEYEISNLTETPVELAIDKDVIKTSINLTPHNLGVGDNEYPDIDYAAISEEGGYSKYWVLRIASEDGSAGLRWKREHDSAGYRAYTLYFLGTLDSKKQEIPVARRYYRDAHQEQEEFFNPIGIDSELAGRVAKITCSKLESDRDKEITVVLRITARPINETQHFHITIPAGLISATKTIIFKSAQTEIEVIELDKFESVDYKPSAVNYKDVMNVYPSLPELKAMPINVNVADYVSGETALIKYFDATYKKVAQFSNSALKVETDNFLASIDSMGILTITKWDITETSNTANVEIKFYVNNPDTEMITTCKYSTLYGIDGEADRLFIANGNNEKNRNIIYFSEMDDFSYFPDNFTKAVGGNANEVKGFIRLANGSMAALKNLHNNEASVFVFKGEYMSGFYDSEGEEPYTLPKFSTSGVSTTQGIIAPYACANLADDSMFLSQNGVYALELSQGTDSQRFAKERSLPINNFFKECNANELEDACAITHENKYYLAVKHYKQTEDKSVIEGKVYYEKINGEYKKASNPNEEIGMYRYYEQEDCVYVADAHYSFKPAGAMSDAPSYEWYPLTNIPVKTWFVVDQELYFGTNDGRICHFVPGMYYDVQKLYLAHETNGAGKQYSQSTLKVISGIQDSDDDGDNKLDYFTFNGQLDVTDNDTITFLSGSLIGTVYDDTVDLINRELYIKKLYDSNGFKGIQLKYTPDGEAIQFEKAENLFATIQKKTVVKAKRVLPTFDFGMPDYLKTLESFTIVMNGVEGGNLVLTIQTRNNPAKNMINMQGQTYFSYLNGAEKWSYNVSFQNSFTRKVAIRNFNYCIFEILNDLPVDCAVSSISLLYKYNQASGGVK